MCVHYAEILVCSHLFALTPGCLSKTRRSGARSPEQLRSMLGTGCCQAAPQSSNGRDRQRWDWQWQNHPGFDIILSGDRDRPARHLSWGHVQIIQITVLTNPMYDADCKRTTDPRGRGEIRKKPAATQYKDGRTSSPLPSFFPCHQCWRPQLPGPSDCHNS